MDISEQILSRRIRFAFILLTYRNSEDPKECLQSIDNSLSDFEVRKYVIDSFHDEMSSADIERVSADYDATYIRVENKGYGYGNNVGIACAMRDFCPDYYVVCNPDTSIEYFPSSVLGKISELVGNPSESAYIIAPCIKNLNGKQQNPLMVEPDDNFFKGIYEGYKKNSRMLRLFWYAVNRFRREIMLRRKDDLITEVYAPHGSFVIFTEKAIKSLAPVFDENIFLFAEELLLASDAAHAGVHIYFCPAISIRHKEDGSVSLLSGVNKLEAESNIYVYEKIHSIELKTSDNVTPKDGIDV